MITINIIDYLADSLEVPEISSQVSEITVTPDFGIKINNYSGIVSYDTEQIIIKLKKDCMIVKGNNLVITYINDKYIVIGGEIIAINFERRD